MTSHESVNSTWRTQHDPSNCSAVIVDLLFHHISCVMQHEESHIISMIVTIGCYGMVESASVNLFHNARMARGEFVQRSPPTVYPPRGRSSLILA